MRHQYNVKIDDDDDIADICATDLNSVFVIVQVHPGDVRTLGNPNLTSDLVCINAVQSQTYDYRTTVLLSGDRLFYLFTRLEIEIF